MNPKSSRPSQYAAEESFSLTGTVSKSAASATVTGTSTAFLDELGIGDRVEIPGGGDPEARTVIAIVSDTSLTVDRGFDNTASGQTATAFPAIARFTDGGGNVRLIISDEGSLQLGLPPGFYIDFVESEGHLGLGGPDGEGGTINFLELSLNSIRLLNGIRYGGVISADDNMTLDEGGFAVLADAGGSGITVTLPPVEDGRTDYVYKVAGAGNVTVAPDGSDLINGVNSPKTIATQWDGIHLLGSEEAGWVAIGLTGA